MIRMPAPLKPGGTIAVTAPSSGVPAEKHARLDLALEHLRAQGFRVLEGGCLRGEHKNQSAPRQARAAELMGFLLDEQVDAVFPPWGGERAIELLELLDFETLAGTRPKWLLGFSDLSTLQLPLTLRAGWATAHGANLMELVPAQTDPLTTSVLAILGGRASIQASSERFQLQWADCTAQPGAPLNLTEPTRWRRLDGQEAPLTLRGRLIGGCLDTIARLAGTAYGDLPRFIREHRTEGTLLFLENCEMNPCEVLRTLWSLKFHGWFEALGGVLLGRSTGPDATGDADLRYDEALADALGDLACPVLCDLDIGHRPPQLTLINGALAELRYESGGGTLRQQGPGEA